MLFSNMKKLLGVFSDNINHFVSKF